MKYTQLDQTSLRVSTFSYGTFYDRSCLPFGRKWSDLLW